MLIASTSLAHSFALLLSVRLCVSNFRKQASSVRFPYYIFPILYLMISSRRNRKSPLCSGLKERTMLRQSWAVTWSLLYFSFFSK
jgi:hypothetical protein